MGRRLTGRVLLGAFGVAIGIGAFWIAARGVSLQQLTVLLVQTDPGWAALSFSVYLANIGLRGVRWYWLLRENDSKSLNAVFVYWVGYSVNNVLPARLGEVFRIEYSHRKLALGRGFCGGALLVERMADLVILAGVLSFSLLESKHISIISSELEEIIYGFIAVIVVVAGVFAILLRLTRNSAAGGRSKKVVACRPLALIDRSLRWISTESYSARRAVMGISMTNGLVIAGLSLLIWSFECLALYLMCLSIGISLSGAHLLLLVFVSSMSTLVPSAPGYVGTYQLGFVVAFAMFGFDPEGAIATSILQQVINIGGATVFGLLIFAIGIPDMRDKRSKIINNFKNY